MLKLMSLLSLLGLLGGKPDKTPYEVEAFYTNSGTPVTITLIKHGTLAISYKDKTIHIDPVSGYKPSCERKCPKMEGWHISGNARP